MIFLNSDLRLLARTNYASKLCNNRQLTKLNSIGCHDHRLIVSKNCVRQLEITSYIFAIINWLIPFFVLHFQIFFWWRRWWLQGRKVNQAKWIGDFSTRHIRLLLLRRFILAAV